MRLEFTVARCLADADTATAALQSVIRAMCETQGWDCGRYFSMDQSAGVLRFVESWGVPIRCHRAISGKVAWHGVPPGGWSGRPRVSIRRSRSGSSMAARGAGVSPMALAPETGENGACVFPVTTDDKVIGVLAFSGGKVREPDDRMLQAVHSIGSQLGRFLQRQQAVDALRRSEMRFRVLNDLTSDWYWEQDSNFRFTQVVGCSPIGTADILGLTHWDLPNVSLPTGHGPNTNHSSPRAGPSATSNSRSSTRTGSMPTTPSAASPCTMRRALLPDIAAPASTSPRASGPRSHCARAKRACALSQGCKIEPGCARGIL